MLHGSQTRLLCLVSGFTHESAFHRSKIQHVLNLGACESTSNRSVSSHQQLTSLEVSDSVARSTRPGYWGFGRRSSPTMASKAECANSRVPFLPLSSESYSCTREPFDTSRVSRGLPAYCRVFAFHVLDLCLTLLSFSLASGVRVPRE